MGADGPDRKATVIKIRNVDSLVWVVHKDINSLKSPVGRVLRLGQVKNLLKKSSYESSYCLSLITCTIGNNC